MAEMSSGQEWRAGEPGSPAMHEVAERVGRLESLDVPAQKIADAFAGAVGRGRLNDLLAGTWLGHALHPFLRTSRSEAGRARRSSISSAATRRTGPRTR